MTKATSSIILSNARIIADLSAEVERLESENKRLRGAMSSAMLELGVPQQGYPAPVANAWEILREALRGEK